jgi:hypothetical protein
MSPPLTLLVALRCEATRLRRGEVLDLRDGSAQGSMLLRRDELAGVVEIRAWLVRTKPVTRRAAGYATIAGARVAHAPVWSVIVDRERTATHRGLEVLFKSFRADPAIPARERANLYRLDCAQEVPILWLNADHEVLAPVLASEGTRGTRARIRDATFDRIVSSVRAQLLLRAATHAATEGPIYAWETAVLDDELPRLFPDVAATDRLQRLKETMSDPADLLARFDDASQAHERTADVLRKLVEDA